MTRDQNRRLWEVDVARGVAIIMVVVYHLAWDLNAFGGWDINLRSGFWHYFQRVTASTFILLVGLSLTLSYRRAGHPARKMYRHHLRRGLKFFALGMVIIGVTWLLLRQGYVQFGILHFIGVAIMIAYPFLGLRFINLGLGLILLIAGQYIDEISVPAGWLVWLGLPPAGYYAVDYFPLVPWFGLVLIGIFLGNWLYGDQPLVRLPDLSHLAPVAFLSRLGRHTLSIYLFHQPVLLILLAASGMIDIGILG
ncbi:MAG: DUF1624 domain-containing protein [Caldilineales bacterium]|nr:DUF1624 domain-containing protein [Caldilineales bacterium]